MPAAPWPGPRGRLAARCEVLDSADIVMRGCLPQTCLQPTTPRVGLMGPEYPSPYPSCYGFRKTPRSSDAAWPLSCHARTCVSKGNMPTSITYSSTPAAHTSTFLPSYPVLQRGGARRTRLQAGF